MANAGTTRSTSVIRPKAKKVLRYVRCRSGCITCRKRKKKCDEARPSCKNCQNCNYVCQGYEKKKLWQPSQRSSTNITQFTTSHTTLETTDKPMNPVSSFDRRCTREVLLGHFITRTSLLMTRAHNYTENPWLNRVMPMAVHDKCTMDSILGVTASYLARTQQDRSYSMLRMEYFDTAITLLRQKLAVADTNNTEISQSTIASLVLQYHETIDSGHVAGEHRGYLNAARRHVIRTDSDFYRFTWEFCRYCEFSALFTMPAYLADWSGNTYSLYCPDPASNRRIGVVDESLLAVVAEISQLRHKARTCRSYAETSTNNQSIGSHVKELESRTRKWPSCQRYGTSDYILAELHRLTGTLSLPRATYSSSIYTEITAQIEIGIRWLECLTMSSSSLCFVLLPTFVIGCNTWRPDQRSRIGTVLVAIELARRSANVQLVRDVMARVWTLIDIGDRFSWHWETVIGDMGYDFLIL